MNKTLPINKQFPMIDIIFWNMIESSYYVDIPESSGITESVKEDEEALLNTLKNNDIPEDLVKIIDRDMDTVCTGAKLYGEEKGFILGFIHGVKMATDLSESYDLLQLTRLITEQTQRD